MTAEAQAQNVRQEAFRLKGDGLKIKEITAQLAKDGWKSNRDKPYSSASIAQMLANKNGGKAMPHKKAAATKVTKAPEGGNKLHHVFAVLSADGIPDATKVALLKTYLA